MTITEHSGVDLGRRAARIGEEVAGPAADDVDAAARFPSEAFDALRADRMLSVMVPRDLGGEGASVGQVAEAVFGLGRHCASTAMVYAMHQLEVALLLRHGHHERLRAFLAEVADHQLLLASATTEVGVGGDIRSSICAVESEGGRFRLEKQAPVISYGAAADAVLATARRHPDSPPSDQVLVLCRRPGLELEQVSQWDALGFRGTCSPGFVLRAEGETWQVMDDPFSTIAGRTMTPVAHVLWGSVWLGLAAAAVDRARRFVRAEARKHPGVTSPGAVRLAELMTVYRQMDSLVHQMAATFDGLADDGDALDSMSFAISVNSLKLSASTLVVDIVGRAMLICGIAGYRLDSPYSLGRLLRDAHGAAVMVNNDRILANNAQMLSISKED